MRVRCLIGACQQYALIHGPEVNECRMVRVTGRARIDCYRNGFAGSHLFRRANIYGELLRDMFQRHLDHTHRPVRQPALLLRVNASNYRSSQEKRTAEVFRNGHLKLGGVANNFRSLQSDHVVGFDG